MVVPRSWTPIELQRSSSQTALEAAPVATDSRFKAAAFLLFCSWITTFFSLCHSIVHYNPRNLPPKQLLVLFLSLIMIGYETTIAFDFSISPLNRYGSVSYIYGLGWAPIFFIVAVMEIWGYLEPNEDRELMRQRRLRNSDIDQELGLVKKPHWWSGLRHDRSMNVSDQIARNVGEIGGGLTSAKNLGKSFEMGNIPVTRSAKNPTPEDLLKIGAGLIFPTSKPQDVDADRKSVINEIVDTSGDKERDAVKDVGDRGRLLSAGNMGRFMGISESRDTTRTASLNTKNSSLTLGNGAPPQKIRSMLDV